MHRGGRVLVVLALALSGQAGLAHAQRPDADREPASPSPRTERTAERPDESGNGEEVAPALGRENVTDKLETQRPIIETVSVHGAIRTDPEYVVRYLGLVPGRLLTEEQFLRASRRLDQLAVSSNSRLRYVPVEDRAGQARVEIDLDERDVLPTSPIALGTIAVRGLAVQKFEFDVSNPTGHGETLATGVRLEPHWQRLELGFHWPIAGALSGLASVTGLWESQLFEPAPTISTELGRRSIGAGFSSWATSWLWWRAGVAADRLGDRTFAATTAGLQTRFLEDRFALELDAGRWMGGESPGFTRSSVRLSMRSTTFANVPSWRGTIGAAAATEHAPYQAWVGAGSLSGGQAYLRAHRLVRNGALRGEVFGRRLVFASVEHERPFWYSIAGPVSWAAFVDAARAWDRAVGQHATPLHVDVGVSLRLRPAALANAIRLDFARGLRDGRMHISLGLTRDWPD